MNKKDLFAAVEAVRQGKLIVYPTEAVWGIGCDPKNSTAMDNLLAAKNRPVEKGVILIASSFEQILEYIDLEKLPEGRLEEVQSTWPGSYTWLMPVSETTPNWITGGSELIAVRVSTHPTVISLCDEFGGAIVSTSANITTQPTPETLDGVKDVFNDKVDVYVNEALGGNAQPSKIIHAISGDVIRG